jgi:hypothetical protein
MIVRSILTNTIQYSMMYVSALELSCQMWMVGSQLSFSIVKLKVIGE